MKHNDSRLQVPRSSVNRVSSAVWPSSMRRVVATGKAAQRRRDWLMQRRWLVLLVDALSLRVVFILTTLLVVSSSLLVALLGLSFWYLLLVPLLLFTILSLAPSLLVSKAPMEAPPPSLSSFAQEFKSCAGLPAFTAQDWQSGPGSFPGLPHSFASLPASPDAPATPMPAEPPLVRVLETYDLREARVRRFFEEMQHGETDEHSAFPYTPGKEFWRATACPSTLYANSEPLANGNPAPSNATQDQYRPNEQ
ncbi:MAG TPA: hypothetical protein VGD98_23680 [Ktedonobacteraceae bacterium]